MFFYKIILAILFTNMILRAGTIEIEVIGKTSRQNEIKLPNKMKYVSFRHEGGFKSNIARYGSYFCEGSIFYDNKNLLENMSLFCELTDQNGDKFYTIGKRKVGSEVEIAVGKTVIFDANGFWEKYIGLECKYGLEYVNDILFSPQKCKMPN